MPIESRVSRPDESQERVIGAAYLAEARQTLSGAMKKIENCLDQLRDEDLRLGDAYRFQWQPANAEQGREELGPLVGGAHSTAPGRARAPRRRAARRGWRRRARRCIA